jgi:hypothetical protein
MDHAVGDLTKISGQKPVVTKSKKAIAGFKIRDGVPIGCMVTLRGVQMYEFLDRLVNVALPRVRDFKGVPPKGFDGRQLRPGAAGAADLPGDRLRQGRQGPGHGHHHRDDGADG